MKTLHVGGKQFFNRFSSLEAALKRAEHDDIIELHRDEKEVSLYIGKNITINGTGHLIKIGRASWRERVLSHV